MNASAPRQLSAFQSLMRGWTELAPYNFIHALRLDGPGDVERWRKASADALSALGFETSMLAIETPTSAIDAHLEAELNRGFAAGDLPLRFFAIEANGGHWFGVAFDHWFADDYSGRALLQRIHAHYTGAARPELFLAKRQPPRGNWWKEWRSFFQQTIALRRARRLPLSKRLDFTVGVFRTELPSGALEQVRALAKQNHASVHDFFLAAIAQASGAAHPWPAGARRDAIGLASAMDLRRFETDVAAREGFGLLISEYSVVEPHPEKIPLPELVARIAEKTRALKAMTGHAVPVAGLLLWRLARSRRAKATLYQRGAPFAAGLSNVNLSGSWIEQSSIAEFRRAGPTGPVVPIVLMITTLHGRISVDTTYRTAAFTRATAQDLIADFASRLTSQS